MGTDENCTTSDDGETNSPTGLRSGYRRSSRRTAWKNWTQYGSRSSIARIDVEPQDSDLARDIQISGLLPAFGGHSPSISFLWFVRAASWQKLLIEV